MLLDVEELVQKIIRDNTIFAEIEEFLVKQELHGEIFINALFGSQSHNTIKLTGTIKKKSVSILIDGGSTHSSIASQLVKD